jgi:glucose/mannose-6-phosphate isomerase
MVNLDNLLVYGKIDQSQMIKHLKGFPELCQRSWEQAMGYDFGSDYSDINKVVVLGMGGSAMGGEIIADLVMTESKLPVWVHRDYELPRFVDDRTLIVVISYSGNTEETLSGFNKAMQISAKKIVMTSGGRLKALARSANVFTSPIDYAAPPRVAFPWMVGLLLGIFCKLGLLKKRTADVKSVMPLLKKLVTSLDVPVPLEQNRAKQLATELYGKIAVIYGAGVMSGVARRWKTQCNENGKNWSFFEVLPELLHNSVVGYPYPSALQKKISVVLLRSELLHPRILVQYDAVKKVLGETNVAHRVIDAEGDSGLAQILSLILLGDFASYYLAVLNEVDPTPVAVIDSVKKYQAEH